MADNVIHLPPLDREPGDMSDYVNGTLDCTFEELLAAIEAGGGEVSRMVIIDDNAVEVANDV